MKVTDLNLLSIRNDALDMVKNHAIDIETKEDFVAQCWALAVSNELYRKKQLEEPLEMDRLDIDEINDREY